MGGSGSKKTPTVTPNDDDIDYKNVEDTQDDYPPPYIPERSRDEVYDPEVVSSIQENVDKIPNGTDANYPSLLKYLCEGLSKEVHQVTAIYLWMKSQDYNDPDVDSEPDGDTPRGYIKMIKEGEGSYTNFFTILCRRSGIPCIILHGIGKSKRYYVGKPESKLKTKWTAVYTDDEWRLVHIRWAIKGARDKNQNIQKTSASDVFFLADPAKFIYMCSPNDFRWQLLNYAFTQKEFLSFPYLSPHFFACKGRLIKPEKGTIKTPWNKIEMELSFPKKMMEKLHLEFDYQFIEPLKTHRNSYDLDENDEDLESSLTPTTLAKYVFINRKQNKFVIEIGLPSAGKYMFDIFGAIVDDEVKSEKQIQDDAQSDTDDRNTSEQDSAQQNVNKSGKQDTSTKGKPDSSKTTSQDTTSKGQQNDVPSKNDGNSDEQEKDKTDEEELEDLRERFCQFKFIAENNPSPGNLEPNPEDPIIGWGTGPKCRALGIVPVNPLEGCIYMRPGEVRNLDFRGTREVDVTCQLVHDSIPVYNLVDKVECLTKGRNVRIRVQIPEEGRYALKVYARDAGTKEFQEACIFLIRQRVPQRFNEKYRDKMLRGRVEHHVQYHTSQEELENALGEFNTFKVPDHGEKSKAETKLKQYWDVKKGLNGAVLGRNHLAIRKWLERAKQSQYEPDLREDMDKAERMYDRMVRRKGYLHPIAKMDQHTMTEIRSYKHPPAVVKDVMKSTYLLLGEEKEDVDDWVQIQSLMGQTGPDSLQRRVLNRHPEDVDKGVAKVADDIIKDYSLEKCRETSPGVGAFYKWCKQFTRDINQQDMDESQRDKENSNLAGRETFRDSQTPGSGRGSTRNGQDSPRNGQDSPRDDRDSNQERKDNQPFRMQEENKSTPRPSMSPMKASSPTKQGPVSYAGFKPQDM